jgi:hypothetical protein
MDISVLFRSLLFTPFLQRPFAADPVVIIDWFGGNRRRSILQHDMCQTKVVTVGWFRIFRADRLQFGSPVFWSRGVRFTWGSVVHITTKSMSKLAYWSRVAQEIMHRAWCLVLGAHRYKSLYLPATSQTTEESEQVNTWSKNRGNCENNKV